MKRLIALRPSAVLVALLVPLLAACGGGSAATSGPTAQMAPITTSTPAMTAATSAPAAPAPPEPVAAAATAAPASGATTSDAARGASGAVAEAPVAAPERAVIPQPAPQPPQSQQPVAPMKAGEVDDNADFATYQTYLRGFYSPPGRVVNVSERYILTVVNDQQQPVLDARVRLFSGGQQVFEGHTYAGGKTIFFPSAQNAYSQNGALTVRVEKGNSAVESTLWRGQNQLWQQTFVLPGAQAVPQQPRLDVMFLLDATSSMGDEIERIQGTLVNIAERIDNFSPRPVLRFGLVAYRDRGDEYVTRVYDFTPDVEAFRRLLLSVQAGGGGDEPESLNAGLHAAIQEVNWADDAVRLAFLVADAPPHLDYANDFDYVQELRVATAKGIKIYPIAASNSSDDAEYVFRQLAQQTLGHFIFLTYQPGANGGASGESTTHKVDPDAFTVERLDDLVVQVVQRELAQALGAS